MTKITDEIRQMYKELKAKADAAYAAAEPQREALKVAELPYDAIMSVIDELIDGADVGACEGCGEPIFDGDPSYQSDEGTSCAVCAPTYQDLLNNPEYFYGAEYETLTADEAKAFVDAHVAGGGSIDDSMAR